jgi:hypothetical protein
MMATAHDAVVSQIIADASIVPSLRLKNAATMIVERISTLLSCYSKAREGLLAEKSALALSRW